MASPGCCVSNPMVPYNQQITGGLQIGKRIIISGTVKHAEDWFVVNLCCGPNPFDIDDKALHIRPYFNPTYDPKIVLNSLRNKAWESEQYATNTFRKGEPFELQIIVKDDGYKIKNYDGVIAKFNHRIPVNRVGWLNICGCVSLENIRFESPNAMHPPYPGIHHQPVILTDAPNFTTYLPVPYSKSLEQGVREDSRIMIKGQPKPNCVSFNINLIAGTDTAFHFNPRFNEKTVVRNTNQDGYWQEEERSGGFPFVAGQPFIIEMRFTHEGFDVAVNGTHFIHYNHRMSMKLIRAIRIEGDLLLTEVASDYLSVSHFANTTSCLPVPYFKPLEGVRDDSRIKIRGQPKPNSGGFSINVYVRSDIAFHFGARFRENVVVRNTQQDGYWQEEERSGGFPFEAGQPFFVEIRCTHQGFDVAVNGRHFINYNHRMSMKHIDGIRIEGDLILNEIF